jgi:putative restriction endonuclease
MTLTASLGLQMSLTASSQRAQRGHRRHCRRQQKQDADVRRAAFDWLAEQSELYESTLPRSLLERGFIWREQRVPIVGPQGIFKPKVMHLPLSITTVADGPYADSFGPDGLLSYKYRGSDPNHRDNVGLRELMRQRIPLVYCHALVASKQTTPLR